MKSSTTFTVLFFLKKAVNTHQIYTRITYNSQRSEFSLRRQIDRSQWSVKKSRVIGNSNLANKINHHLAQVHSDLLTAFEELCKEGSHISPSKIKARYLKEDTSKHTLLELIEYHYNIAQVTISVGTLKNYRTTGKYLRLFILENYKSSDINLCSLTYSFLTNFDKYLRLHTPTDHQRPMKNNTVMKHQQRLRKMVTMSVKLGWISTDPFIQFKARYTKPNRSFLSLIDLNKIELKQFSIDRLILVQDLFIFSCYTGLSYIDVITLTKENINIGIDGNKWIYNNRTKTDVSLRIPLLNKAEELIKKYSTHPKALYTATLFPKMSNQKLNSYLKEIADLCGITSNLTFHVARHTFATTVTLSNGVPIETVSKLLGHTKIATTQIYAKVVEHKVSKDLQRLQTKLNTQLKIVETKKRGLK